MTTYGMDSSGFTKKKLADIKLSMEENLRAVFGVINTNPESVFGQIIGAYAEVESKIWDLAEDVYYSQYPNTANDIPLDNAVGLTGVTRLPATSSTVNIILLGTDGTIIPSGTQFEQINTAEVFESDGAVTIDKSDVLKTVISIANTGLSTTYIVTIDGDDSSITNVSTDENTLLALLLIEIEADKPLLTVVHDTVEETLTLTVTDMLTPFSIIVDSVTANLALDEIWTPKSISSVNKGELPVGISSITLIVTPVSGLTSVDNLLVGTTGTSLETDDELRLRRIQSLRIIGAASVPAIQARILQEVEDVQSVTVIENPEITTDIDGRPPKSIECIVTGGDDDEIAEKIWAVKAGGIYTHSSNVPPNEINVLDSEGTIQVIRFSRPIIKYVHMNIEVSLYDEETFPTTGLADAKTALKIFGDALNAGDDLIIQRFFTPIYTVDGILNVATFEFAITEVDEAVAVKESGSATSTETSKLHDTVATFITSGVISGMVIKNTTDNTYTTIVSVDSEIQLTVTDDIFVSGETYNVGVLGPVNIPISASQIGGYAISRIAIATV